MPQKEIFKKYWKFNLFSTLTLFLRDSRHVTEYNVGPVLVQGVQNLPSDLKKCLNKVRVSQNFTTSLDTHRIISAFPGKTKLFDLQF